MNENWNQDTPLHLADALADEIARTPTDTLLAEVAEDFGDRRALVNKFDTTFARALRRSRRRRIAVAMKNAGAQVSRWLLWKPLMASAGTLAAAVVAVVVYEHRIAPLQVAPGGPIARIDLGAGYAPAPAGSLRQHEKQPGNRQKEVESRDRASRIGNDVHVGPSPPRRDASPGAEIGARGPSPPSARAAPPAPIASRLDSGDAESNRASQESYVSPEPAEPRAAARAPQGNLRWPVQGRVISSFSRRAVADPRSDRKRDDGFNVVAPERLAVDVPGDARKPDDGISIAVPEGSDIHAAGDGVVSYVGSDKTFGNLVVVRHDHGLSTAYGHASEVLVKLGDVVQRGQVIAKAGHTGDVMEPQLYFEVRKEMLPVDPMQYLSRD